MVCPKCVRKGRREGPFGPLHRGEWGIKVVDRHPRQVCKTCGHVDPQICWVDGRYVGPVKVL